MAQKIRHLLRPRSITRVACGAKVWNGWASGTTNHRAVTCRRCAKTAQYADYVIEHLRRQHD